MAASFQDIPEINLKVPTSPLVAKAWEYVQKHSSETVANHAARAAYFSLIIGSRQPGVTMTPELKETIFVSAIMHDLGWVTTPGMMSQDLRFEVDGANMARDFLRLHADGEAKGWDEERIWRVWYAIALHTHVSIHLHAQAEVAITGLGVSADFLGPVYPNGPGKEGNMLTSEEYLAVMKLFPRLEFTSAGFVEICCGLCRSKPATTYNCFVSGAGLRFGTDGKGGGKEEYAKAWEENQEVPLLIAGLDALVAIEKAAAESS